MAMVLKVLRLLLATAVVALWLSPARADCLLEPGYEFFLSESEPVPAESMPCCVASIGRFLSVAKGLSAGDRGPGLVSGGLRNPVFAPVQGPADRAPSPTSRPYCARSSRLLL